jgi:N-acetylhexosamine 1-kinase
MGAFLMTLEVGVRFLTDYLDGDRYFRIAYPQHNLDRAKNQLALAKDIKQKLPLMEEVLHSL